MHPFKNDHGGQWLTHPLRSLEKKSKGGKVIFQRNLPQFVPPLVPMPGTHLTLHPVTEVSFLSFWQLRLVCNYHSCLRSLWICQCAVMLLGFPCSILLAFRRKSVCAASLVHWSDDPVRWTSIVCGEGRWLYLFMLHCWWRAIWQRKLGG